MIETINNIDYSNYEILVVDDTHLNLQMLGLFLKDIGFKTSFAMNGFQALKLISIRKPDLILLDVNMPDMDGYEVCKELKSNPEFSDIPIIFLTARNTSNDIVKGFESGGIDYVTKPFQQAELLARLSTHLKLLDRERKLQESYDNLKKDLEAAAKVQQAFLPNLNVEIDNYRFSAAFIPSVFVSGDTFNYFKIDNNNVAFYIIDVAGHGISSAFLSVTLSRLLSSERKHDNPLFDYHSETNTYLIRSPKAVLNKLNSIFAGQGTSEYFTMIYGIINLKNNKIVFSQAGHPAPIIISKKDYSQLSDISSFPIGLVDFQEYSEYEIDLNENDKVFFYSDGITDCLSTNGKEFKFEALNDFIRSSQAKCTKEILTELMLSLENWHGTNKYEDDITIFAIERLI